MLGRILISLISMIFCFLRASAAFFWLAYFSLPRSRILQTGGVGVGGNLDEVEAGFFGHGEGVEGVYNTNIFAFGINQLDFGNANLAV
jgi:hypothetical protein